jgi:hypothetical protein
VNKRQTGAKGKQMATQKSIKVTRYDSVPDPVPDDFLLYIGYVEPPILDGERHPRWILYFTRDFADFYGHRDPETGHVIGDATRSYIPGDPC